MIVLKCLWLWPAVIVMSGPRSSDCDFLTGTTGIMNGGDCEQVGDGASQPCCQGTVTLTHRHLASDAHQPGPGFDH